MPERNWRGASGGWVLAGAFGAAVTSLVAAHQPAAAQSPTMAQGADNRPRVDVVHPSRATLARRLKTNATLEAFEEADLFAKVSGYLSEVRVDIGDHVKAGDVLAVIWIPEMEKELAEAEAQLAVRQRALESAGREVDHAKADVALQELTLKRQESLHQGRAITDQALDEVRSKAQIARADLGVAEAKRMLAAAQVDAAAAAVDKIKTLLAYSRITAPFDGVVARRLVNRGDLVQAATASRTAPLFTLERIEVMRVFCDVPESYVAHLRAGDGAVVAPIGLDGAAFQGKVTRFAFRLNPETRNMRTEVDLPNPDERLYPGMYAEVVLEMDRRENALTVPATAVAKDDKGSFVLTVLDDHIARTNIKTGLSDGGRVEVLEGLAADAAVVSTAKGAPPPGTAVQPAVSGNKS
jgi:RND family efflux transporter MFP subunit